MRRETELRYMGKKRLPFVPENTMMATPPWAQIFLLGCVTTVERLCVRLNERILKHSMFNATYF